jgi:hypothetical protein
MPLSHFYKEHLFHAVVQQLPWEGAWVALLHLAIAYESQYLEK